MNIGVSTLPPQAGNMDGDQYVMIDPGLPSLLLPLPIPLRYCLPPAVSDLDGDQYVVIWDSTP